MDERREPRRSYTYRVGWLVFGLALEATTTTRRRN